MGFSMVVYLSCLAHVGEKSLFMERSIWVLFKQVFWVTQMVFIKAFIVPGRKIGPFWARALKDDSHAMKKRRCRIVPAISS